MHPRNELRAAGPAIAVTAAPAPPRLRLPAGARLASALGLAALLGALPGCASKHPQDNTPTLKSLDSRTFEVPPDKGVAANDDATIAAYRDYLKKAPPDAQRPEAMRRLGDLEMDSADSRLAGSGAPAATGNAGQVAAPDKPAAASAAAKTPASTAPAPGAAVTGVATGVNKAPELSTKAAPPVASAPGAGKGAIAAPSGAAGAAGSDAQNYGSAVTMYLELLKTYPKAPDNDKVLYQLAHAYELGGDLESALKVLNRLVREYPHTSLVDEAHFRRGELMFAMHDYHGAEEAYATILTTRTHTPYFERALYMHGWSLYKQDRLDEALQSFFGVLDLKLIARESEASLDAVLGLTRADRELVEDTLRVVSLCLENLQGAESIPPYMGSALRRDYEFRIYRQLGELYLAQERVKDAADTFLAFARRYPAHAQAPVLQARVIEIYQQAGFDNLVLAAKREYVERYGLHGEFHKANPAAWGQTLPRLKSYLAELARRDHAIAQKSHKSEDYLAAAVWYRQFIETFPKDPDTAQANFLLAELLFEDKHFGEAAVEYEKTAYHYLAHPKSADAGYAALLAYVEQEKLAAPADRPAIVHTAIESALRFADAFPADPRDGPVLANAAERLYAMHDLDWASSVAHKVLKLTPPAGTAQQRTAWTVIGLAAFDSAAFDQAEAAYTELLARTAAGDPERAALTERLAACVYKQGEQARSQGKLREAVADFNRVAVVAPLSPVRAAAQYDAAAVLIAMRDWPAAALSLEDFRQRFPKSPLVDEAGDKLALVYSESGQWALAGAELERVAGRKGDDKVARAALWQAAELYDKAAKATSNGTAGSAPTSADSAAQAKAAAVRAYERYVQQFPEPLEPAIEARSRLARLATEQGNPARALVWTRQLLQAEQAGGAGRTEHTRYLGANAALLLAQGPYEEFHKVALVEPLKKQLALKKSRMEEVLKAYAAAADYGVAEVSTAATFHTAEVYHEFGQSLMSSERPKALSGDELEQYNVLLEEQSFPFEEKAIAMHEANVHHSAEGIYDQWIKNSYAALAQLRPLRYGKAETSEDTIDAIR
jgi:TolA-binding protein